MDAKNVIAAISLSAAVIILYGLFFAPDPQTINQQKLLEEENSKIQTTDATTITTKKNLKIYQEVSLSKSLQELLLRMKI